MTTTTVRPVSPTSATASASVVDGAAIADASVSAEAQQCAPTTFAAAVAVAATPFLSSVLGAAPGHIDAGILPGSSPEAGRSRSTSLLGAETRLPAAGADPALTTVNAEFEELRRQGDTRLREVLAHPFALVLGMPTGKASIFEGIEGNLLEMMRVLEDVLGKNGDYAFIARSYAIELLDQLRAVILLQGGVPADRWPVCFH